MILIREKSRLESKANLFITSFYGGGTFPENKLTDNCNYIIHVLSSVSESPFYICRMTEGPDYESIT